MAKRFFAQHGIPYTEKDVTTNEHFMQELENLAGRFITPTLSIDGEVLIGFGMNMPKIQQLLQQGGYL
jgi:glutaredoxin 3